MTDQTSHAYPQFIDGRGYEYGLTKREYFAAKAMEGLLANPNVEMNWNPLAKESVAQADALIAALNEVKE